MNQTQVRTIAIALVPCVLLSLAIFVTQKAYAADRDEAKIWRENPKLRDLYNYQWSLVAAEPERAKGKKKAAEQPALKLNTYYALKNQLIGDFVTYGWRGINADAGYGINLIWWKDGRDYWPNKIKLGGNKYHYAHNQFIFMLEAQEAGPITSKTKLAIKVKGGPETSIDITATPYLRYEKREYGINIGWSKTPAYEWMLIPPKGKNSVQCSSAFKLYNENDKIHDAVVYCPREYGINLGWHGDWKKDGHCGCEDCGGIFGKLLSCLRKAGKVAGSMGTTLAELAVREISDELFDQLPGPLEDVAVKILDGGLDKIEDTIADVAAKAAEKAVEVHLKAAEDILKEHSKIVDELRDIATNLISKPVAAPDLRDRLPFCSVFVIPPLAPDAGSLLNA